MCNGQSNALKLHLVVSMTLRYAALNRPRSPNLGGIHHFAETLSRSERPRRILMFPRREAWLASKGRRS